MKAAYEAVAHGDDDARNITKIAEKWNAAGVTGLNGQPWSASTLSLFLCSPRNAATAARSSDRRRRAGEGHVDAVGASEELWRAAQVVLNGNAHAPKSIRKHLLTGVLRCGKTGDDGTQCLGSMGGQWVRQAGNQDAPEAYTIAYTCKTCRGVTVRAEHVEPLLMGAAPCGGCRGRMP